jgi:predicted hydrocarbon binding protein
MSEFFYPQSMGRILLMAMEEVLGEEGLSTVLKTSDSLKQVREPDALSVSLLRSDGQAGEGEGIFSFTVLSRLLESLECAYGPRAGQGISLRVGRACSRYGLREFGSALGLTTTPFRLLPLPVKLRTATRALADLFNNRTDQRVRVEEQAGSLLWHMERCPLCWGRHTSEPICHLAVGLAQEALYWLSGGKIFNVEETTCVARGDPACTLQIDKVPIS